MFNSIRSYRILFLVFGTIFSVLTRLRFPGVPIGVGETLLIIYIISTLLCKRANLIIRDKSYFVFLTLFLIFISIGTVNSVFLNNIRLKGITYDFLAYFFSMLFFMIVMSEELKIRYSVIKKVLFGMIITFGLSLVFWKFGVNNILGLSLHYSEVRFTGGAKNPNQLALAIVAIPLLIIYFYKNIETKRFKTFLVHSILFFTTILIGVMTKSDALIGTWIIVGVVYMIYLLQRKINKQSFIIILLFLMIVIVSITLISILSDYTFVRLLSDIVGSFDQDGSRLFLWKQSFITGLRSPLFGYGPGQHVEYFGVYAEAHNLYLDVFLQSGIFGILFFLLFLLNLLSKNFNKFEVFLSMISLLIFSFAHFPLRQPIFWFLLVIYNTIGTKIRNGGNYNVVK